MALFPRATALTGLPLVVMTDDWAIQPEPHTSIRIGEWFFTVLAVRPPRAIIQIYPHSLPTASTGDNT